VPNDDNEPYSWKELNLEVKYVQIHMFLRDDRILSRNVDKEYYFSFVAFDHQWKVPTRIQGKMVEEENCCSHNLEEAEEDLST